MRESFGEVTPAGFRELCKSTQETIPTSEIHEEASDVVKTVSQDQNPMPSPPPEIANASAQMPQRQSLHSEQKIFLEAGFSISELTEETKWINMSRYPK
ncbi:hypothetical protein AVEN_133681-1 [Araneus ventricosus]|uniref:Uncharacterized protein n=1 Tax=Araneus ventricosus TaxID=182803 RepID=A0A4Y2B9C7_ARAVE|nr:hypothetical protein AVEN_133681-1 [Araneus ventricosus]